MKRILSITFLLCTFTFPSLADEGMWMVNTIDKALERNMKKCGSKMSSKFIYDEEKGGLSDAIVSLAFGCTGSMISEDGLMITNHHCAYADIFKLSTPEHNYLEDGFWADRRNEEIPVFNDGVYFLRKVIDVTDETRERAKTMKPGAMGSRKLAYLMEKKYGGIYPGQEVSLYSMYAGEKYYIMVYDKYKDVRLVAAPPVCVGAFGGDIDNWEWPQHKGDFAIYRIYTAPDGSPAEYSPDNVPLHPRRTLKVSTKGVRDGDFTMVMGYPGITNRYASSFEIDALANEYYPIIASMKKERMDIMTKWMNTDPATRLKYSNAFFSLSNVQEIREGEMQCFKKFKVADIVAESRENTLEKGLLDSLKSVYDKVIPIDKQIKYFQECGVRSGNLFKLAVMCKGKDGKDRSKIEKYINTLDLRVEKDIFLLNVIESCKNIEQRFWGDFLRESYEQYGDAVAESLWNASALAKNPYEIDENDPVVRAMTSMNITAFNNEKTKLEGKTGLSSLRKRYKVAVYRDNLEKGIVQYPDANSSMRLTYGNVKNLIPMDGVLKATHTTTTGILEKINPDDYNFTVKPELMDLYNKGEWGRWAAPDGTMWVNFLTTNDITGGNSGSPVMNAKGELVGLAFDGNKEGLAGDVYYDPVMNRCVCADIRYVMWILENFAHMDNVLAEILK